MSTCELNSFFSGVKWHPDEHGVIAFDCRNRKWYERLFSALNDSWNVSFVLFIYFVVVSMISKLFFGFQE